MRKLLVAALCTLTWGLVASVPAAAAEVHVPFCGLTGPDSVPVLNCTFTQNFHGTQSFPTNVPCVDPFNGPNTGTLTITGNSVFHVTVNGAGDAWLTGTTVGEFSFIPFDSARPSYRGHAQSWFGQSFNQNNHVFHDTLNLRGTGSDGSTLTAHLVDHMSISASGITLVFDKIVC